jgi:hypothetical protein
MARLKTYHVSYDVDVEAISATEAALFTEGILTAMLYRPALVVTNTETKKTSLIDLESEPTKKDH